MASSILSAFLPAPYASVRRPPPPPPKTPAAVLLSTKLQFDTLPSRLKKTAPPQESVPVALLLIKLAF